MESVRDLSLELGVVIGAKYFNTSNMSFGSACSWVEGFGGWVVASMENAWLCMG